MTGGTLPASLICAALGLALGFAEAKDALTGLAVLTATAATVASVPVSGRWSDAVFLGCWASVIASAVSVHLGGRLGARAALSLSVNAGVWTGAVIALSPSKAALFKALPWALCAWPAAFARRAGKPLVVKVVTSWLIAVALLAAAVEFLPVIPGYLPDHLE